MPFPILLFAVAAVGVAAAAASSKSSSGGGGPLVKPSPILDPIAQAQLDFDAAAKRGEAERDRKEAEARAEVNRWYDDTTSQTGPYAIYFKAVGPIAKLWFSYAIDAGKAISNLFQRADDWNSAERRERARALFAAIANMGFLPTTPIPGATDDFASWGDVLEQELSKLRELFNSKPETAAAWSQLRGFIGSGSPVAKRALADAAAVGAWPITAPGAYERGAMAIATLFASMRGRDPAKVRAIVGDAFRAMPKNLREWQHFQWRLGWIIDAADRATR